ncbi:MAG TPA: rRNA adenine N-6-methyltransferase family protein [Candidatus Angelobacter sp.]|nr:rRNA adenine N-6-methyltransferase family protein [Candidatus Angelobacter sp.]
MVDSRALRNGQKLLFVKNFLQHPNMLGSVIPSSRFLIDRLLSQVDWDRARTIVEYGPGVGTITSHILDRMSPDARLVVVEKNENFVSYLKSSLDDPRLHIVHGSAEAVQVELTKLNIEGADYIISGVPYTPMPKSMRARITQEARAVLNPGGTVLFYQFTRTALPYLRSCFNQVNRGFEPRNIPPAYLFFCTQA